MVNFDSINEGISKGNISLVKEGVTKLLEEGIKPLEIINDGLMVAMNDVGIRFKNGDMFVPEVMMSAKALHSGLEIVKPLLSANDDISKGKILIGTVRGDLHDIGKNLVAMMLESSGFTVINMGVDISEAKFIEAINEHNPDILGMSALLTTTMPAMESTIKAIEEAGLRNKVKIIIGGAPVSHKFANEIGADGYSDDAQEAISLCEKLLA
ncbi:MAG: cobalamin B12-binding domain-containing protein [Bacillota bacterium]|jgi:5-methyltetrahydrofolate--homocysteine methyltransferase